MATDALLALAGTSVAPLTKTAAFTGAALVLPAGTPRRGLKARVIYSAASTSAGTGTVIFGLDVSYDGGVTWYTDFQAPTVALSITASGGELVIPFEVSPTSVVNQVQVRLSVEAITGTTATVTYFGDVMLGRS